MTKALINTYSLAHEYGRHIMNLLLIGCFAMIGLYVFNVYRMIANTIALQSVVAESVAMESDVQNLDSKYLKLTSQITPDTLSKHGFTTGKVSVYIPRNQTLGSVAIGGYEL